MAKTLKSLVPLTIAIVCIVLMAGYSTSPKAEAQPDSNVRAETPPPDKCILVEAFIVEVRLDALDKLGVSPIGQKPNAVTVENILDCLGGKNMAQVSTGLKVSLKPELSGEATTTETVYVQRLVNAPGSRRVDGRNPMVPKSFRSHEISKRIKTGASIGPNGRILVGFTFDENTYREITTDDETPDNTISRQWSGTAYLEPGEPAIVGATQDEETAVFLVLCADIQAR